MAALSAPICCGAGLRLTSLATQIITVTQIYGSIVCTHLLRSWSTIDFTGNTNHYSNTDLWQHCLHPSVAGLRLTSLATQIITVPQIYGSIVCTHLLRSWSTIDFTGNTNHYSNTDLLQHCLHPSVAELV